MATVKTRDVALLSIHPRYADAILAGIKRVEFRKTRFRREVSHVVIYATSPVMGVVGYFSVAGITTASPAVLWTRYRDCAGLNASAFRDYYAEASEGTALEVGAVRALAKPLALDKLADGLVPPQSFAYLDGSALFRLERAAGAVPP